MNLNLNQDVVEKLLKRSVFQRSFSSFSTTWRRGAVHPSGTRNDAQTESLDRRETLRNRDGSHQRQRTDCGDRPKISGVGRGYPQMARTVLRRRQGGAEFRERNNSVAQSRRCIAAADRGTGKSHRTASRRDPFFKKAVEDVKPSWNAVEAARVEGGLKVDPAMRLLGMSRSSYYRQIRGMADYQPKPRQRVSFRHREALKQVALKRPEAGHRKVRAYAVAWQQISPKQAGTSRMSCYRVLKSECLIQPGRPAGALKEIRDRRRQMLEIPKGFNEVL